MLEFAERFSEYLSNIIGSLYALSPNQFYAPADWGKLYREVTQQSRLLVEMLIQDPWLQEQEIRISAPNFKYR